MQIVRANPAFINSLPLLGGAGGARILSVLVNNSSVDGSLPYFADGASQNFVGKNPRSGDFPVSITNVRIMLASGKFVQVNTDFVMQATPDLAAELIASGLWSAYTLPANYALFVPSAA